VFCRAGRSLLTSWVSSQASGNAAKIKIEVFHRWEIDLSSRNTAACQYRRVICQRPASQTPRTHYASRSQRAIWRAAATNQRLAVQPVPASSLRTSNQRRSRRRLIDAQCRRTVNLRPSAHCDVVNEKRRLRGQRRRTLEDGDGSLADGSSPRRQLGDLMNQRLENA